MYIHGVTASQSSPLAPLFCPLPVLLCNVLPLLLTWKSLFSLVIVVRMSIHTRPRLVIDCPPLVPYPPPPLPTSPTVDVTCFQRRHHNISYIVLSMWICTVYKCSCTYTKYVTFPCMSNVYTWICTLMCTKIGNKREPFCFNIDTFGLNLNVFVLRWKFLRRTEICSFHFDTKLWYRNVSAFFSISLTLLSLNPPPSYSINVARICDT